MNYPAESEMWEIEQASKNWQIIPVNESRVLARFKQVFPLSFFPDDLIIEELRIVWVRKSGPWMDEVISIMATDIASIDASAGPFFGHIHIKNLTGGPEIMVNNLWRGDVYRIRGLIEGISLSSRVGLRVDGDSLDLKRRLLSNAGLVKLA